MRILFDARVLQPKALHGIARHGLGLFRELLKNPGRHSYLVLACSPESAAWLAGFPGERDRFELRVLEARPYRLAEQFSLPRLLAQAGAGLYYSPTFMPPVLTKTPVAFTIHDLTQIERPRDLSLGRRLVWRFVIRPKARRCGALLTVSEWSAQRLARWLGPGGPRVQVVGNGLEEAYRPRTPQEIQAVKACLGIEGPYFVMMGNPMPHKNLHLGAAAFQRLCTEGFRGCLVVVGAGDMELPEGPGRVIRARGLDDPALAALHGGALATLFPSLAEGFGLPPLEALACGAEVVVADLPVYNETLGSEGVHRFAPQSHDPGPLAGLMRSLAVRKPEGAEASAGIPAFVHKHTWARAGARLRDVFDSIEAGRES